MPPEGDCLAGAPNQPANRSIGPCPKQRLFLLGPAVSGAGRRYSQLGPPPFHRVKPDSQTLGHVSVEHRAQQRVLGGCPMVLRPAQDGDAQFTPAGLDGQHGSAQLACHHVIGRLAQAPILRLPPASRAGREQPAQFFAPRAHRLVRPVRAARHLLVGKPPQQRLLLRGPRPGALSRHGPAQRQALPPDDPFGAIRAARHRRVRVLPQQTKFGFGPGPGLGWARHHGPSSQPGRQRATRA